MVNRRKLEHSLELFLSYLLVRVTLDWSAVNFDDLVVNGHLSRPVSRAAFRYWFDKYSRQFLLWSELMIWSLFSNNGFNKKYFMLVWFLPFHRCIPRWWFPSPESLWLTQRPRRPSRASHSTPALASSHYLQTAYYKQIKSFYKSASLSFENLISMFISIVLPFPD